MPTSIRVRLIASILLAGVLPLTAQAQLRTELVAEGFARPVAVVPDPLHADTLYVVEQAGTIRAVVNGVVQPTPTLDIVSEVEPFTEQGLLSLAFDPAHPDRAFIFFIKRRQVTDPDNPTGDPVIARLSRSQTDARVLDPATRFDLRWPDGQTVLLQPSAVHKGGQMHFGPDGYLYIGLGDGGLAGHPEYNAQTPSIPHGKMLRIDVSSVTDPSHATGYLIPPDNPFLDGQPVAALPMIWSFGWRNPWRWSFDDFGPGATGALIAGDVGEADREEINYEPAGRGGRNYGWYMREGSMPTPGVSPFREPAYLPFQEPLIDYPRSIGRSVTGGYVYRGSALPAYYRGRYFVADFFGVQNPADGTLRAIYSLGLAIDGSGEARVADAADHSVELGQPRLVSSFGRDLDGELLMTSFAGGSGMPAGRVLRIVADTSNPPTAPVNFTAQVNGGEVTLNWQRGPDGGPVLAYHLEAGSSEGAADLLTTSVGAPGLVVSNVPAGLYWVRVRGENAGGTSPPSLDTAVRVGCAGPPLMPSNLSAVVGDDRVVALTWTRAADASSYVIEAGSAPGLANLAQLAVGPTALSVLAPPGQYYVRVRGVVPGCGLSPASNEIVVTVP